MSEERVELSMTVNYWSQRQRKVFKEFPPDDVASMIAIMDRAGLSGFASEDIVEAIDRRQIEMAEEDHVESERRSAKRRVEEEALCKEFRLVGGTKCRKYFLPDCQIELCTAHGGNPKKPESKTRERFDKMRTMLRNRFGSVKDALDAGYLRNDLRYDAQHGFISVHYSRAAIDLFDHDQAQEVQERQRAIIAPDIGPEVRV
jgi:hypothetical protein